MSVLLRYIRYLFSAKNAYRIHSPFVYEMYTEVYEEHFKSNVDYELVYRVGRLLDGSRYLTMRKRKLARFLYRYAAYYEPKSVYLYGKVTAMAAAALALGNPHARVMVVYHDAYGRDAEGSGRGRKFVETLNAMGVVNVELKGEDDFHRDFVEIDGEETLFVVQGHHFNRDMEAWWDTICEDEDVTLTLDFYRIGMVLYREGMEKQNFVIK